MPTPAPFSTSTPDAPPSSTPDAPPFSTPAAPPDALALARARAVERLADDLARILGDLLPLRIVAVATSWMKPLPWPLRAIAFSGGLAVVARLAGRAIGEPRMMHAVDLWAGLLLAVAFISYAHLAVEVHRTARRAILPALCPGAVTRGQSWAEANFLVRRQGLVAASVGLVTALLLAPALRAFTGTFAPATLALVAIGATLTTGLIYIPGSVSVLGLLAIEGRARIFALDPYRSPLVRGLLRLGQRTAGVAAILATVGALGPLLMPGLGVVAYVLAALVFFGGVLATLAQFLVQQYAIGALVSRARSAEIAALQARIEPLFARHAELSSDARESLASLLELYDRVCAISPRGFSVGEALRFARPLLLPCVTALLTSMPANLREGPLGALIEGALRR
jgi:hypothetical protein